MVFGLYRKSHLFNYFMILPTCVYFLKKYLPYGQTFHRITGTQVKGSNLAKLFLELASAEKITKMTYSIDSGHRYSPAVIGTAVVMIKFRLWLGF